MSFSDNMLIHLKIDYLMTIEDYKTMMKDYLMTACMPSHRKMLNLLLVLHRLHTL